MVESTSAALIGATGFIGRGLPLLLAKAGIRTTGYSRREGGDVAGVDEWRRSELLDFAGHQVVINLAGEPIDRRWTAANKRRFFESRVGVTHRVVEQLAKLPEAERPRVLVNGSAVGVYGDCGEEVLTEQSALGDGYLAELCRDWEQAACEAEALGVRVVALRTGVVLGRGGKAFERLHRLFRWGMGGRLGHGRQWMPWIHVDDLRAAIVHAVVQEDVRGPINGTAPVPERNADFTRKLARAVHRPALLPVPGFALKLALGGFGEALLSSQNVRPQALEQSGFGFAYPTFEQALREWIP